MKEMAELIAVIILISALASCEKDKGFCITINGVENCVKFGANRIKESKP